MTGEQRDPSLRLRSGCAQDDAVRKENQFPGAITAKENYMNEEMMQQLMTTAERLANAAESLDRVLGRLDAQQETLGAKVDRIVAAVEERPSHDPRAESTRQLQERVAELEKSNADLKAQAARLSRKTLPPLVSAILAKSAEEGNSEKLDKAVLDKTLQSLSIEQRIAVKSELARAGIID
jgi:predicted RNase H-like nuclease (RuvC/YqgF family)